MTNLTFGKVKNVVVFLKNFSKYSLYFGFYIFEKYLVRVGNFLQKSDDFFV